MSVGDKIKYEKNLEAKDFSLPQLILQPIVENMVNGKMNIESEIGSGTKVTITIPQNQNNIKAWCNVL